MSSNIERKARRKNQTRLTFDPINQITSAENKMSPAKVRLRNSRQAPVSNAQTVPFDDHSDDILSSSKKSHISRTPVKGKKNGKLPFKPLPTPVKSSQAQAKEDASDELGDLADESEADIFQSAHRLRNSSAVVGSVRPNAEQRVTGLDTTGSSTESSDLSLPEVEIHTPSIKDKGKGKDTELKTITVNSEEELLPIPSSMNTKASNFIPVLPNRSTRDPLENKKPRFIDFTDSSDDELALPEPRYTQNCKRLFSFGKKLNQRKPNMDENSDSEDIIITSQPKRRPKPVILEDDDSEDSISSPAKRRRQELVEEEEDDDDGDGEDDDDEDPISSPLKRRRQAVESDISDIVSSPFKRKRNVQVSESSGDSLPSPSRIPQRTQSPSKYSGRQTRQAKTKRHRTEKERNLELLKRKRAGENIEALTESSESDSDEDSGLDFHELSEFEDDEEEVVAEKSRTPSKRQRNEDCYDSDGFVVEDEDAPLGVPDPTLLDIPLEFTHAAHKPLKEHFKDAIEWMVHNKINPAFARDDSLYVQAFMKLDDECGGYAKSKFVSSQWTAEFTRAIYARPEFLVRTLAPGEAAGAMGEEKCDVCNHRAHRSSFEIQFRGNAYHKNSLEVEQESDRSSGEDDENSSQDSDKASVNADGQAIPSVDMKWNSGRFCKANAEQAHALIHWKFALNEWVVDNLERQGYLAPDKLAEREKMKSKQRRDFANVIVDSWDENSQIKELYRDFKLQLESAREAKQSRWNSKEVS